MEIKKFVLGNMDSNSYLYYNPVKKDAFIIDIGGTEIKDILNFIENEELNLKKVILTHGHIDHIVGLKKLLQYNPNIDIYIGREDLEFLYDPELNLSKVVNGNIFTIDRSIDINIYNSYNTIGNLEIIHAPGHTEGSKMLYDKKEDILFVGDVIFKRGVGRTDFPGGSLKEMEKTIKKLLDFPEQTLVYPGHGPEFTLKEKL